MEDNKEVENKQPQEPKEQKQPEAVDNKENKEPKEPKTEDKKAEDKDPAPKNNEEVETLKKELATAQEVANQVTELTNTLNTLKVEVEAKDTAIKNYEGVLNTIVETKLKAIPDEYKELIPENLDVVQKLEWLNKAENTGIFKKEDKQKPNVEIGKPMNVEKAQADTTKLTGSQLMRMAYNSFK